ncbi:MAG: glycosyltransferase [Actinomycetota bacterium]
MEKDDRPLLSIITVNFNGRAFLKNLFDSISELNYPRGRLQVIMVDNGSTDGSADYVNRNYPWVEVLPIGSNLGYAGGNNEGFKAARGRYIALINNDCTVGRGWAEELLAAFRSSRDEKIGAVGPKIVFYYPYIALEIASLSSKAKSGKLGVRLSSAAITGGSRLVNRSIKYLNGFYPPREAEDGSTCRWTDGDALLALPVSEEEKDLEFEAKLYSGLEPNRVKLMVGGRVLEEIEAGRDGKIIRVVIPKSLYAQRKDIINSCGVKVNRSFYARERGYLSFDEGQFSRREEVFGLSGTSFMADRKMLEDVGFFDRGFFTYYEDIDLFWRARLKGWKSFTAPRAVARHHHCGTGSEWSYDFTYYVLRNRMLMIFKCGWPSLFLKSFIAFFASMVFNVFYSVAGLLRGRKINRVDIPIRVKLFFKFFYLFAFYFKKRLSIRRSAAAADNKIRMWIKDF